MAGHSKWANIKHRKARVDKLRGKLWSKCSKAIMIAARGGPDPAMNLSLRYAVEEAKAANMPKGTIQRAIDKGSGAGADAAAFEAVRYEGYGPAGVAVIVDCLTDNRQRTAPEMRLIFSKVGGNLGTTGCVAYNFEHKGQITGMVGGAGEEALMELAIEAGAENIEFEEGTFSITTAPEDLIGVKDALDGAGIETESAELTMLATNSVDVAGGDVGAVMRLVDALEDNDDVQKVYTNMEASAEDFEAAEG